MEAYGKSKQPVGEQVLVDAETAAAMCAMHRGTWYKKVAAGLAPKPVSIGGVIRWRKAELEEWIVAGCPARSKWENTRCKK